jgi:L-ascorbate metabolism protein UlaG (beta-lactamase superfamily)
MIRGLIIVSLATAAVLASCSATAPRHNGPTAAPMEDGRFVAGDDLDKSLLDVIQWQLGREPGPDWEFREVRRTTPGAAPDGTAMTVTLVNHATTLIQMAGRNVLTDPVWSERISPLSWAGPRRYASAGIAFDDLPAIDAVLVSHNHFDHMDLPTLERLARRHDPVFVVPLANCHYLAGTGTERCRELDWWEATDIAPGLTVQAVPARHWSRRGAWDRNRALWSGYVLNGPKRVYFAGDTGAGPHFAEIARRTGRPDLAMLPIGAYLPRWFMSAQHINPAEAVEAHRALGASQTMAIHFGTFRLADDGQDQPVSDLARVLDESATDADAFWVPVNGERRQWQ